MGNGVKVVGASAGLDEVEEPASEVVEPARTPRAAGAGRARAARPVDGAHRGRAGMVVLAVIAVLGIAGTVVFWRSWSNLNGQNATADQASRAASTFLVDLTNFDAKSVDADFGRLQAMATGQFAKQAGQFFNSSIRQQLENALASSRGQVRNLYVQSVSGPTATVYAVVDQLFVNRSLAAPQSDVLRVVVQMTDVSGTWKVSDVTVLEGPSPVSPSPTSTGSSSGG